MNGAWEKKKILEENLRSLGGVAIAFSSGVDSTFLLKVAHDVLGERAIAVTACSCSFPKRELDEAKAFCAKEGISHIVLLTSELEIEGFAQNPINRCYLCKKELLKKIIEAARERNINYVAEGSNVDDNGDYRPGLLAVAELNVKSPLREAGLTKSEIRQLSKELGLPTWDKPSFACLASRFPYGEVITKRKLAMVENAEQLLMDMGFSQVRVRIHDNIARIEVDSSDFGRLLCGDLPRIINERLQELGFAYVALDLGGYKAGNMNKVLQKTAES